jgi:rSAM/selenodomain-associated transferase 1
VLAKWPRAGRAKRRLGRMVGSNGATSLARAFLKDTLALSRRCGANQVVVAYAPPAARAAFARLAPAAHLVAQPRGGFGTRLRSALDAGHAKGKRVVLIGTDSPTLPAAIVRRGFARLERANCVLGPATDGGYYLIGARERLPDSLFVRMPWSSAAVAAETLRRARDAVLRVALLPTWYDVDDEAGLARLTADRGLSHAPATRAALGRLE